MDPASALPPELITRARDHFDLTEPADQERLYDLAETLLAIPNVSRDALRASARDARVPLELKLAAKLVEARRVLAEVAAPMELGVVFAMWGEQHRLRPRSAQNAHGEDLLRVKLHQLEWATRDTPIRWRLYAVDDGCPHGSGEIARAIARDHPLGARVTISLLADALPAACGPLSGLHSVDDSRKGGAVIHGCSQALADGADAVIYTDADNSVHLGQIGLLIEPQLRRGVGVVLGTRKHPDAVLVKQEARWGVGIVLLRHMQRRIGEAIFSRGIQDTQAAFKLYERRVLSEILERPSVYDFSFDTDWIASVIAQDEAFETVPFAFIDSFEQSASITQGPMTTWFALLSGLADAVTARGLPHDEAMLRVLRQEIESAEDLERLIHRLPPELADATDEQLGESERMPADVVEAWIRHCKAGSPGDVAP
jgi:hypothetical protein